MADRLASALQGAAAGTQAVVVARRERALVVGAGGVLGSALLAEALVAGRFDSVAALVAQPLASALRGFTPLPWRALASAPRPVAELAFVVFERDRYSNGRDDAFFRPEPDDLVEIAAALHAAGVRRLVVVVPHAPALLPGALAAGFASHAEREVAALAFEHLVFLRSAQATGQAAGGNGLERFAAWWLSQLRWMIPARQAPVRAVRLAQLTVLLGRRLAAAPPGTRVLPPELLWEAAQLRDENQAEIKLGDWLARR